MYRHLLVPLDGTDLSVEVIGNAVAFARTLAARITFFHAVPPTSGLLDGDAEVLRLTAHGEYEYRAHGRASELLAKAEAAARAYGVPCESHQTVSDRPAQAAVERAHASGCDLIFLASHGHRSRLGMAFTSEMFAVLMSAGVPVLVSSTGEPAPPARAIAIVRDEHRSLTAVVHAWIRALSAARLADTAADPGLMRAIVRYLQAFALQLHHPKEEEHLFRLLRERTTSCHAELDELERQHQRDATWVAALAQRVEALAASEGLARVSQTRGLEDEVSRYANFLWDHLGREEGVVLPAAQRYLTAEDWATVAAAFDQTGTPESGAGVEAELHQLFAHIVEQPAAA